MQIGGFLTAGFLLAVAFIQWSHPSLSVTPSTHSLSDAISSSATGNTPSFEVQASGLDIKPGTTSVDGILKGKKGQLTAQVFTTDNKLTNLTPSLTSGSNGALTVNIPGSHAFRPGKYRVVVESKKGSKTQKTQTDFTWGVLAANLDKSTYHVGEIANLGLAVLDDKGVTVCNAKIDISITDSRGHTVLLSTANGTVKPSITCKDKNITNLPDYAAAYKVGYLGTYRVAVTATTKNGIRKANLEFVGTNTADFVSTRTNTATRIYPADPYIVHLSILVNKNFTGSIREDVPAVFTVTDVKVTVRRGGKVYDPKAKLSIADAGDATAHIASGLKLIKGDTVDFTYTYKAPFISPQFYQLGPAKLVDSRNATVFQEPRTWQIASDSAGGLIMLWDPANGAIPSGWTCISCISGDTFYQRFPRIANSYGATGGGPETVSHTFTINTIGAGAQTANSNNALTTVNAAVGAHSHSFGGPYTTSSDSIVPPYVNLKVIQSNAAASTILSIPLNMIAVFDVADASLPSGWTHVSSLDTNYLRGENAACASSCGSSTHTHVEPSNSGVITSGVASNSVAINTTLNTAPGAIGTHTHTITPVRGASLAYPNAPAYSKLNFAKNTVSNSAIPSGLMAFFDTGSLPVGWTNATALNANYNNTLIVGSSDPTSLQFAGSDASHCHHDLSAGACQVTFTSSTTGATVNNGAGVGGPVATSTHTHAVLFDTSSSNSVPNFTTLYLAKIRTITVSGTTYSDEGVTTLGTQTMRLAIAGGAASRDFVTAANGTYSQYVPDPGPGGVYTLWINSNGGNVGTTIARSSGSDISGLDVYQNRLMLRHYDAGPVTNADIGTCDKLTGAVCADADQHYSVTTGNLTVDADTRLLIGASSTYTPGGAVTLTPGAIASAVGGDLKFAASTAAISMGANALNVPGDWINTAGGTFTGSAGQVTTFTATTTGFTIDNGNTQSFQGVTFAGNGGTGGAWSFAPAANNVTVSGDLTISTATTGTNTVTAPSGTLTVGGSYANNGSFAANAGTVLFSATTAGKTIAGSLNAANAFNNITFNGVGGGWSFGVVAAYVNAAMTITNGTVTAPSTTLTLKGNYSNAGTFTHNSGTVAFSSATGGKTLGGTMTGTSKFNNLTFTSTGVGAWSFGANNGETANNLTINSGVVTAPSGTLTITNNYANSGTLTHNSGTVIFNATATGKTLTGSLSGTSAFNNLTFNGAGGDWTPNVAVGVSGNLTVTAGSLLGTQSINVSGGSVTGNGTINLTGGTFTLTGTGSFGGTSAWSFSTLIFGTGTAGTTTALASSGGNITIATTETIGASQILNAGSHNWIFTANATPFVINGTFTPQTSTVTYQPSATTGVTVTSTTYHNVTFNKTANTFSLAGAISTDTASSGGNLTITAGTLDVTASNFTITNGGNWTNSDTFNSRAGLITFNAIGTGHTLTGAMTGTNKFFTLTFNGVGGDWTFAGNSADVGDNFTITNGTVTAPSTTLTLTNNYTNNGTFTHNSGTVLFNAAAIGKTLTGALSGTSKFNNLTFTSSGTGAWSIGAAGETAANFTIGNATSTVTLPATTLTVAGNFANSGTFTHNSGTAIFNATTSGKTINDGASSFNNVTFNGAGGVWSPLTSTLRAVGDLLMTAGTLDNSSGTADVIVNGNATGTAGLITLTGSGVTFTQRVAAAKQFGTTSGAVAWAFTNLTLSNSSGTAATVTAQSGTGGETVSGVLTLGAGGDTAATTLDAGTGGRIWALSGTTGTPFALNAGSGLLGNVSTFSYTGNNAGGDTNLAPTSYNILTIGGAAAENYSPSGTLSTTSDFLVNTNAALIGTQIITVGGQFYGAGTVTLTGGKVSLRSAANTTFGTTSGANNWTFNDLSFENASGASATTYTWNGTGTGQIIVNGTFLIGKTTDAQVAVADDVTNNRIIAANGDVTIATKGELRAPVSASFTAKGSWSNLGLFTSGAGTVNFTSAATGKTLSGNLNSTSSFNKIIFNNAAGGWAINNDLRTASDLTLTAITTSSAVGLIVPASVTVEVDGTYSFAQNAAPDGTNWDAASTLNLNPASTLTYTVGSRTQTAETYGKLTVGSNANIRTWNSGEAGLITVNIGTSGSLYSQNDGNTSGVLKVYGNYHTGVGQTNDCWQYAKDFDCSTTVARQVLVTIETGASRGITVDSGKILTIVGGGAGVNQFTNVDRIGASGTYLLANSSGSPLTPTDAKIANVQFTAGVWNALNVAFSGTAPYVLATAAAGTTLTPDWYFSTRIKDRTTAAAVQTAAADVTVAEASANATVFKETTGSWSGAASQTATSDAGGNIPQPQADGALRLREYSQSSNGTTTSTSYYRYNVAVAKQSAYTDYDFFRDWGNTYITSSANTGAGLSSVMSTSWFRDTDGTKNTESAQNVAPTSGSNVVGDSKAIILLWDPANGAVPSGWTSVSEAGGPLNQMFIKGAALYANTCTTSCPESVAHNFKTPHGITETDPTGTQAISTTAGLTAVVATNHAHSFTSTFSSSSTDIKPLYYSLQLIRGPAAGDSTGKWPTNIISFYGSSGLPSGWASYDNLNNDTNAGCNCQRYSRADASAATARGGAAFHTHTVAAAAATAGASTGTINALSAVTNSTIAATGHTHTAPTSLTTFGGGAGDTTNNLPPYVDVKYAKLSASASPPDQVLGMFDYPTQTQTGLTLASGWSIVSGASTIYNGNLLRGASTPGGTGGATTHTHGGSVTLTSGAASATAQIQSNTGAFTSKADHTHNVIYDVDTASGNNSVPNNADLVIGKFTAAGNTTPVIPTTLAQVKVTGGTTLTTGGWVNETQLKFTGLVADTDATDTDQLCVEIKPINTAFSFVETACGSLVAYSGTAVAANVTITGLSDQTEYHWQASTKDAGGLTSSWASYGGNLDTITADRDFGIDTTPPTSGTVYDNYNTGAQPSLVDTDQNGDGSLTTLSASWGAFDLTISGLLKYQYSIGRTSGATDLVAWTDVGSATSIRLSGLTLTTGEQYFINVRAYDNAGNISSVASSDGQMVTTLLTLSISSSTVAFNNLTTTSSYDSQTTGLSVTTNATSGYSVKVQRLTLMTLFGSPDTIPDFSAGSYAAPVTWPDPCSGATCGFGYTSSDTRVGGNLFATGSKYAPFASSGPGDTVMTSSSYTALDGSGVATAESRTVTNKVSVSAVQAAGRYQANILYTVIPVY
jgi:hypothetical protein